jgi:glyoxylase-like metal-dependent hydrolase (beta-lactamase superfamily II)
VAGPCDWDWAVDPALAGARELRPGLWRLRLPWAWEGVDHVNAYLLSDGVTRMVVDCGPAGHPTNDEAFDRALGEAGTSIEQVDHVVLTHAHSDHCGQLVRLKARAGPQVWLQPDTAHVDEMILEPERSSARRAHRARLEGAPDCELPWFGDVREEHDGIGQAVRGEHRLDEGDEICSPLGPLKVLHTPGHAPSQIALVQREQGFAIVGDTICARFSPYFDYGYSADPVGEALESLARLGELGDIALALPGHGRPLTNLPKVVRTHQRGMSVVSSRVRDAVAAQATGAYDVARRAFGTPPTPFTTFAYTNLAACALRHLRLNGEVVRDEDAEGRFRYRAAGCAP